MTTSAQTPFRGIRARPNPMGPHERYSGRTVVAIGLCAAAIAGIIATAAFAVGTHHDSTSTAGTSNTHPSPAADHAKTDPRMAHQNPRNSPAAIEQLQTDLTTLGYYSGPVNGVMNVDVEQATMNVQRDAGLRATGVDNPATQAAIATMMAADGR